MGVNYDIGHSFICDEDIPQLIRTLAEKRLLRHVHLENIEEKEDGTHRHSHLIPGEGNVRFPPILRTLQEIDYQGCVTLELYRLWGKNPDSEEFFN